MSDHSRAHDPEGKSFFANESRFSKKPSLETRQDLEYQLEEKRKYFKEYERELLEDDQKYLAACERIPRRFDRDQMVEFNVGGEKSFWKILLTRGGKGRHENYVLTSIGQIALPAQEVRREALELEQTSSLIRKGDRLSLDGQEYQITIIQPQTVRLESVANPEDIQEKPPEVIESLIRLQIQEMYELRKSIRTRDRERASKQDQLIDLETRLANIKAHEKSDRIKQELANNPKTPEGLVKIKQDLLKLQIDYSLAEKRGDQEQMDIIEKLIFEKEYWIKWHEVQAMHLPPGMKNGKEVFIESTEGVKEQYQIESFDRETDQYVLSNSDKKDRRRFLREELELFVLEDPSFDHFEEGNIIVYKGKRRKISFYDKEQEQWALISLKFHQDEERAPQMEMVSNDEFNNIQGETVLYLQKSLDLKNQLREIEQDLEEAKRRGETLEIML
ncbi:hypothetical protein CO172_01765 [Candidatus Uhrbacteria bacterium CG_4_9_14_3_um_filter_36_7]|uniref:Uncharacterized protein n=1 Tax=Candidatus Uhrbacteria bacterium CG_4_9_14_3_um_filter_36_7 TaxID=1975033 RepID=A0A2M7XHK6_9BACT|nr:MAG: hypothetical protein CO172_01765 [Candidatus Uhrbacteria bacterium CG_4_9_14_3_um_filter_36_7]